MARFNIRNSFRTISQSTTSSYNFQQNRYLSESARSKITKAISSRPVVLFMKGTPTYPQCGFSRAVVQLLDLHSVSPTKLQTYNCLEDSELREGIKEFR
ncbi:hypothetical protein CROQUDRAFT_103472 [Cronartium quercuum f. sp. fusiforme G11]|uniref:Glutaredoxin domain-containing protein n=1 Tax=Cronartium quercuum f. sp. fusiforme G11 TaxID=708437 RepID=A0A9P6TH76_9BASI|nr:hypothetical protein CROQUDRAFT_103472 [Cronartium quercuum f. sp. fusiforme G11]